jgi:hypothetical protein
MNITLGHPPPFSGPAAGSVRDLGEGCPTFMDGKVGHRGTGSPGARPARALRLQGGAALDDLISPPLDVQSTIELVRLELEPYDLATYAPQVEALAEAPALALVAIRGEKGSVTPVSSPFKLEWQYA